MVFFFQAEDGIRDLVRSRGLGDVYKRQPAAYTSMGITAENVARQFKITRADQDAFALRSHQRATAAIQGGRFRDEITPVPVEIVEVEMGTCKRLTRSFVFDTDEGPRGDSTLEALAKLRPVFHVKGTVTAGNSSQTSDGAAVVLVMEREEAERLGLKPLVRFVGFAVGGVPPEVMGIGPIAVSYTHLTLPTHHSV